MKKILFFCAVGAIFSGVLTGCGFGVISDPAGYSYYVWSNESDHVITLSGTRNTSSFEEKWYRFENKVLQPGERLEIDWGGGIAHIPSPPEYAGVMIVVFDETLEIVYGYPLTSAEEQRPSIVYEKPYNPTWDYAMEKLSEWKTRWTYTFTNANYDAAVAYSQEQKEEQAGEMRSR